MGRLPSWGIGWYRKNLTIPAVDRGRSIFLDVDGAMAYATVWLNGRLVGGWPYGYNGWRLDLTPYVAFGGRNQLAIRGAVFIATSGWSRPTASTSPIGAAPSLRRRSRPPRQASRSG
jgi:beta-galactosidase/beta-glucuronidase